MTTLRASVQSAITAPISSLRHTFRQPDESELVWVLRDVSFELKKGTVLGVIGRNGAGKSTLLKILSRITEPTEGFADIFGRMVTLLEVGTGFHPELTGRDNVFLNGAILGMTRREIAAKFDEIVDFAGVQRFIDTPVKRYSSGMHMRLAFAVAAHLEADILLVDEVLAVGDADFQKKCIGKMREVTGHGRTVIFVSHNMAAIRGLCDRLILLRDGRVVADGDVDHVVGEYLVVPHTLEEEAGDISVGMARIGTGDARFTHVNVVDGDGRTLTEVRLGQAISVVATLDVTRPVRDAVIEVGISTLDGIRVTTSFSVDHGQPPVALGAGVHTVSLDLDVTFIPGHYSIDLGLHHTGPPWTIDMVERVRDFDAINLADGSADSYPYQVIRGYVRPPGQWRLGNDAGGETP